MSGQIVKSSTAAAVVYADLAAVINAEHTEAIKHAAHAIDHARHAGALLLQVKEKLPHGQFLRWLALRCTVSARQAQRYISAAQGKPLPVRAIKCDTVSHLPQSPLPPAMFEPIADCAMYTRLAERSYFVEQSDSDDFFFVSAVWPQGDDDTVMDYMRRPVRGWFVESVLRFLGLAEPHDSSWRIVRGVRVTEALAALENATDRKPPGSGRDAAWPEQSPGASQ